MQVPIFEILSGRKHEVMAYLLPEERGISLFHYKNLHYILCTIIYYTRRHYIEYYTTAQGTGGIFQSAVSYVRIVRTVQ